MATCIHSKITYQLNQVSISLQNVMIFLHIKDFLQTVQAVDSRKKLYFRLVITTGKEIAVEL